MKDGDRRRGGRGASRSAAALLAALAFCLLLPLQGTCATVQMVSGVTEEMGNALPQGSTSYNVYYSYPSVAAVGTDLNFSLTMHINPFKGQIEYIFGYALEAKLFIGLHVLNQTVYGPAGFNSSSFLYPGAYWGPNNFTFPLTENNTGLLKGQSANATLQVTLKDTVYYGVPVQGYMPEPAMQAQVGSLTIENAAASSTTSSTTIQPSSQSTLVPYALLASGAVLMAAAVFFPRGPRAARRSEG